MVKRLQAYSIPLVLYGCVAAACGGLELAIFAGLYGKIGVGPAAVGAFLVATSLNFLLSRGLVFHSKRTWSADAGLVVLFSTIAFCFNFVVLLNLVSAHVHPIVAKLAGSVVGFVINFTSRQLLIFSTTSRYPALARMLSDDARLQAGR